ncbi:zf-TFIIB domain-containing protein [Lentisphaerota bacterium WC36G]|nr:zf-TFIIB domain-containing protein [Lentisphaerae bacterium WC36]
MKCAKCDGKMCKKNVDGVDIDICGKCSGVWFDFDRLEQVLVRDYLGTLHLRPQKSALDDEKSQCCPRCGDDGKIINVKHQKQDITLEKCNVCSGIWLDKGEFDLLKGQKSLRANLKKFFGKKDED